MSYFSLHFSPVTGFELTLLILLLVSLLLSSKAMKKRINIGSSFTLKVFGLYTVNLIAHCCLAVILLKPTTETTQPKEAMLLTQGFQLTSELLASNTQIFASPEIAIYEKDWEHLKPNKPLNQRIKQLNDLGQLPLKDPEISKLIVNGNGLTKRQWQHLPSIQAIAFYFQPDIQGIIDPRWKKQVSVGELWYFSANFKPASNKPSNEIYTAELTDLTDQVVSTQRVLAGETFVLEDTARVAGALQYKVSILDRDNNELTSEVVHVYVNAPTEPINIMIVQGAPSFATRHLMDWATVFNSKLFVKSKISKDKFLTQKVNISEEELSGLHMEESNNSLAQKHLLWADLLIIDGFSLTQLSDNMKEQLSQAIEQGLGLYIRLDDDLYDYWLAHKDNLPPWLQAIDFRKLNEHKLDMAFWQGEKSSQLFQVGNIAIDQSHNSHHDVSELVTGERGENIVAKQSVGIGAVAVSRLKNIYSLKINGNEQRFSQYWQMIMQHIARPSADQKLIPDSFSHISSTKNVESVCVSSQAPIKSLNYQNSTSGYEAEVLLVQDSLMAPLYCGFIDSFDAGWVKLSLDNHHQYRYIYGEDQWLTAFNTVAYEDTMQHQAQLQQQESSTQTMSKPVNLIWIWVIFVLACLILWLERKLFTDKALKR